jgi:hypothetical protein
MSGGATSSDVISSDAAASAGAIASDGLDSSVSAFRARSSFCVRSALPPSDFSWRECRAR